VGWVGDWLLPGERGRHSTIGRFARPSRVSIRRIDARCSRGAVAVGYMRVMIRNGNTRSGLAMSERAALEVELQVTAAGNFAPGAALERRRAGRPAMVSVIGARRVAIGRDGGKVTVGLCAGDRDSGLAVG